MVPAQQLHPSGLQPQLKVPVRAGARVLKWPGPYVDVRHSGRAIGRVTGARQLSAAVLNGVPVITEV